MTDRKLLEDAAKAAGIEFNGKRALTGTDHLYCGAHIGWWNPLTDDGDALRLAVKLGMDFGVYLDQEPRTYTNTKHLLGYGTTGEASWQCHKYFEEPHDHDPYSATRRAIVRAAAAIGAAK
jgi:hypothetical protein